MALIPPFTVVNDPQTHDIFGHKIVKGMLDFPDDRPAGIYGSADNKKWWAAVKGAANAHGGIQIDVGTVTGVTLLTPGCYTTAPTVTLTGGGGTGATATATVANGAISGLTLTAAGSGYTTVPTITFSGGGGTGASAAVQFNAGKAHIDVSAAQALPGVKGVFWFENNTSFVSSWFSYGAPIAGVVAEDWETAQYACTLINVTYVTLPVVFDADAAASPSSPLSGKSAPSNVTTSTFTRGLGATDPTAGLATAQKQVTVNTGWYRTMQHNPILPKTAMVYGVGNDWYGYCVSQTGTANAPSPRWPPLQAARHATAMSSATPAAAATATAIPPHS